jgi:hypothetical protein
MGRREEQLSCPACGQSPARLRVTAVNHGTGIVTLAGSGDAAKFYTGMRVVFASRRRGFWRRLRDAIAAARMAMWRR